MGRIIVLDTETTGFPSRRYQPASSYHFWNSCRLVQIAWQLHDDDDGGALVSRTELVVKPDGFSIPNAHIHGITVEFANEHGVPISAVVEALRAALTADVSAIVAHNVEFDNGVVLAEMYRLGGDAAADVISRWRSIPQHCTMRMAMTTPTDKWLKLSELYARLFPDEPPPSRLHRADVDVELCAKCYFALVVKNKKML
jgi:DNA polymerase III epsilon subunit-like protein